ncbi:TolC family protein [Blastopirellula retiformator]|uniref:Outer membrane efflux protein n=1 Tax=Blastopirellula retiformator TaxID=2527970 RepID=A0A5C5VMV9_9BACT|nr:TolC family protein [Blastopirellula retiformator]TWT39363.1 Outer membrane efflux protein [Blastopirellula retiformator]
MLHRWTKQILVALSCVALALNGCSLRCWRLYDCPDPPAYDEDLIAKYAGRGLTIEDPVPNACEDDFLPSVPVSPDAAVSGEVKYANISLQEAVETALANSQVMKDLGGVLRSPDALETIYDPGRVYTDGQFGEEAALSAFDASFGAAAYFEQNDYGVNNVTVGQNGLFKQDYNNYEFGIEKKSVTGATFSLRNVTQYDNNNQEASFITNPFTFGQSWTNYAEAQWRQPLLQGAGVMYNRIAGPNGEPGFANGVLVARTRTDISLAEFEVAVRNLVSDVENAYWDLYYAYRDLDAKVEARDNALRVWQNVQANAGQGRRTADQEGQAREQYYRFESEVINSLHGRLTPRTQTNYGSSGGTFVQTGGVRVSERRLRVIMAVDINGPQLLRPSDDPPVAKVKFDWDAIALEAVARRPELRRQKWVIKQKELELLANKNFLKPQLDLVARYRLRGFGKDLWGYDQPQYDNAVQSMMDGDFQEYQMGIEFDMPIGFRRGHAAVRSSELALAREKAILREQENFIMYGLSNTYGEIERAHQVMEAQFNRREAAYAQQRAVEASHEAGFAPLDLLLEAQRRVIDANILFYQARVDYAQAIKNVHYEKGSLLEHNNIFMAEGPWPQKAYNDALQRDMNKRHALTNFVINDALIGKKNRPSFPLEPSKKPYESTPIFEGPAFPETSDAQPAMPQNPLRQEKSEPSSVQPASATAPVQQDTSAKVIQAMGDQSIDFGGEDEVHSPVWIHRAAKAQDAPPVIEATGDRPVDFSSDEPTDSAIWINR